MTRTARLSLSGFRISDKLVDMVHYEIVRGLIETGACPSNDDLASRLGVPIAAVEDQLRALAEIHGVVLHPHECRPWIVHPFSLTPTLNWIEGSRAGWWAPCIWCALGVAALVGGDVQIHSRLGAEGTPLTIPVRNGNPAGVDELLVHFAIPPAKAWNNVHEHCALVLPFRSESEINDWCVRHRLQRGEGAPLSQVARLARLWYGTHASPTWRKWTIAEAQSIFREAGFSSTFWDLGEGAGRF